MAALGDPGLLDDLAGIPMLDAHMHPPLREAYTDKARLLRHWYEGPSAFAHRAEHLVAFQSGMGELARWLGCRNDADAVAAALTGLSTAERWARALRHGNVTGVVADLGHPPPDLSLGIGDMAMDGLVAVSGLLRIERLAGDLARADLDFDDMVAAFDAALDRARADGFTGLKSIIAYRSGLDVDIATPGAARAAYASEEGRTSGRLTAKPLLDFLFWRALRVAARENLPLQLHCGYGDADIDLLKANPLLLRRVLAEPQAARVSVVLLHGAYPYAREAAWLAATDPRVIVDVCACIPPVAPSGVLALWQDILAVAPTNQIQVSSDATGLPEQVAIGAIAARRTLALALSQVAAVDRLPAAACLDIATAILHRNADRIYFGKE